MRAIVVSLLLAAIPLAGIAYMVLAGDLGLPPRLTMDGLFMAITLLTISGILALNALLEARARGLLGRFSAPQAAGAGGGTVAMGGGASASAAMAGLKTETGVIEAVEYYDAPIGQSNKSFVTLRTGKNGAARTLVLCGNVRGLLIPGRRMELVYRPGEPCATLVGFDFR